MSNAFIFFQQLGKTPFAMTRNHWGSDRFLAVVTNVVPRGKYGVAYGFAVKDESPNEHFDYDSKWCKHMTLPNAGSYQWSLVEVSDPQLQALVDKFNRVIAPKYNFTKDPYEDYVSKSDREKGGR